MIIDPFVWIYGCIVKRNGLILFIPKVGSYEIILSYLYFYISTDITQNILQVTIFISLLNLGILLAFIAQNSIYLISLYILYTSNKRSLG